MFYHLLIVASILLLNLLMRPKRLLLRPKRLLFGSKLFIRAYSASIYLFNCFQWTSYSFSMSFIC